MLIYDVRHDWPKKAGYNLNRPAGRPYYIFAHYYADVTLQCGDALYEIPSGGCILMEPNIAHRMDCAVNLIHNWIHLGEDAVPMIQRYGIPLNTPLFFFNSSTLSSMFWKMETEFYSSNPFKEDLLEGYVKEFFIWLHRSLQNSSTVRTFPDATVRKMITARQTILSSSEKNWTLEEMAALTHFSPSRFHAIYKTLFGTTPTKDLINIRISLAKSLLRSKPDMPLVTVAETLGYNDQYHFIRQFKAATGQSPGKYRKNNY